MPDIAPDRPASAAAFFSPGRNCWRASEAEAFSLVIDGAAYFRAFREALIEARDQVMLIGWDFDLEIELLPGESDDAGLAPDGWPNRLDEFLEAVVEAKPDLVIHLLRWTGSVLIAPGRLVPVVRLKLGGPERVQVAFDGHHPVGACHHQKIVVIDDALAFCGGIDVTDARWDTPDHAPGDPCRVLRSGEPAKPWHDLSTALRGQAARDLGDLARARWARATGVELVRPVPRASPPWPASLKPRIEGARIAISRTEPPETDMPLVNETEALLVDAIRAAQRLIYIESQYFAAESVAREIVRRLREPDGPEVIVINPKAAANGLEDAAMHRTRDRLARKLRRADRHDRFCLWSPVNAAEEDIYVHAKLCIVDDWLLRVGSSNINRRSFGYDTECDVACFGHDRATRHAIAADRNAMLAEHLGVSTDALSAALRGAPRIIPVLEELRKQSGRGVRNIEGKRNGPVARFLDWSKMLDPRYPRDAQNRGGFTWRHVVWGGLGLAVVVAVWFGL